MFFEAMFLTAVKHPSPDAVAGSGSPSPLGRWEVSREDMSLPLSDTFFFSEEKPQAGTGH